MLMATNKTRLVRRMLPSLIFLCLLTLLVGAQQPQDSDATRQLWDTTFINQAKPTAMRKPVRRSYRIATPQVPITGVSKDTVIGVTLWRLRPTRPTDTRERINVQAGRESVDWLPERVSTGGRLVEGDRIRMSIEAARSGYIYVVDQEQYADGSRGEPYLIFPTTRTRGGDNSVKTGRVIEVPAQDDAPPYFTLKRTRNDHVGEIVSVLVSPTPIESLTITDKAQKLSVETLASWEKQWGSQTGRIEMENGEGKAWTKQEKDAGADGTRALKADEPAPQTIYYSPKATSSSPVMVKVALQYVRKRPR